MRSRPVREDLLRMRLGIDTVSDYTLEELGKQFDVDPWMYSPDRKRGDAKADASEQRRQTSGHISTNAAPAPSGHC